MNIVNKLTLRHLKENKGRTVITTLGICVSVAMITAVFVAVASFMNLFGEITYLSMGHWHVNMTVNQQQLEQLENDDRLASLGLRNESLSSSFLLEKEFPTEWEQEIYTPATRQIFSRCSPVFMREVYLKMKMK